MPELAVQNGIRLVVGANRGLGLALVREQLRNREVRQVIATHRPNADLDDLESLALQYGAALRLQPLDITSEESLSNFAIFMESIENGCDLAINAAGILHESGLQPEKSLAGCRAENLKRLFEVNSIGPLMVAKAVLPVQSRNRHFVFAALSAMVGSIGDNRLGGWYGYRASKSALNQFVKTLANECRLKHPGAAIVAIHPGTTDTALSQPFQQNVSPEKLYSPAQSAKRILHVLESIDQEQSGHFLNWDGNHIPW